MHRFSSLLTIAALVILAGMLTACAGLGTSHQVLPSSLDRDENLDTVLSNLEEYDVLYSGPVYNPSAILFLPREGEAVTAPRWKVVEGQGQLTDLLTRMRELRDPQMKLWALVTPGNREQGRILGYVYTAANVSVRKGQEKGTYTILNVPEQFNPRYYDENEAKFPPRGM
ncbi:MAG: hypothetical protein R6U55_14195 [Desulfovermiculus sp.]